jgi:hypothetical protein
MKRYECHFTDEAGGSKIGMSKLIIAKTPEAAAKEFSNDKTKTNNKYILVAWAGGNPKIILNEEENLIVKEKDDFKNKLELTNSNLKDDNISLILTKLDEVIATLGRIKIGITDAASLRSSEGITKKQGTFILILLLAGLGLHPLSQFSMPTKWEYMIAAPSDTSFQNEMDRLGKRGWELVNARKTSSSYSASYECILKRKVSVLNFGKK